MGTTHQTFSAPGSIMRFLRMAEHLTQKELESKTGVATNLISRMERGMFGKLAYARAVADVFGVNVDMLVKNDFATLAATRTKPIEVSKQRSEDYRERQIKRSIIGGVGEDYIVRQEQKRLAGTGYDNLVNGNYAEDRTAGFDVLSFSEYGVPRYIEVKSTILNNTKDGFDISSNELEFAKFCAREGLDYQLIHVFNMRKQEADWKLVSYTAQELLALPIRDVTYHIG